MIFNSPIYNLKRTKIGQMAIRRVLVYAIDRFGRNSIEIAVNKQRLKKNRKTLISATQRTSENIDGTKNLDGILLENMYIWYEHSNGHNKNLKWELKRFIFGVNQKRSSCKRIPICKAQKNNNQSFPYSSIKTIACCISLQRIYL